MRRYPELATKWGKTLLLLSLLFFSAFDLHATFWPVMAACIAHTHTILGSRFSATVWICSLLAQFWYIFTYFTFGVFGNRVTFPLHTCRPVSPTRVRHQFGLRSGCSAQCFLIGDWVELQRHTHAHTQHRLVIAAGLIHANFLFDWLSLFSIRRSNKLVDVEFLFSGCFVWYLFSLGINLLHIFAQWKYDIAYAIRVWLSWNMHVQARGNGTVWLQLIAARESEIMLRICFS